jgi:signal transduction histidine kinase
MSRLNRKPDLFIYQSRTLLSVLILLTIGYFLVFARVTLPPLGLFLGWHPDTQLVVLPTIEEQYQKYVQPGDVVLAVDGRPVRRGDLTFQSPVKPVYELTLQRGRETVVQEIVVGESQLFEFWEISRGVLAVLIWFLGFLTVQFARPQQTPAVIVGLSFQLIAAGIVSPGPSQFGAPGAWLVGQVLIWFFPLIMLYLSFFPRYTPLGGGSAMLLQVSLVFLSGLALVAAWEQLLLFPEKSLADVVGIRSQTILTVVTGISLITAVFVLLARVMRLPKQSYERRQLIVLFTFLVLAIAPLFFFVIVPVDQTVIFAPFPFIYSFFLLAPAGYFFVLHRQGRLSLDALFSQIVTVVVLVLAVSMAYVTGLVLFETVFQLDANSILQGVVALSLFGVAMLGQRPVQSYVDLLIYGRDLPGDATLQEIKACLSGSPEPATVTNVLGKIAAYLQVEQTAVLVKEGSKYVWLAGNTAPFGAMPPRADSLCLRTRDPHCLEGLPEWVELSLPISSRGEMLGLLLLSRPLDGHFNGRQVDLLQNIADILAFSLLVISLVGAIHDLSQRALHDRELQRQRLATEIHNEPLHTLTTLMMELQTADMDETVRRTAQTLRKVTRDLRRIMTDLRPSVLKDAVDWIARQVAREFEETHSGIVVRLDVAVKNERQASETTKMAFYYILTEALNNVIKHAQATQVTVMVRYDGEKLKLAVRDNGVGPGVATRSLTELLRRQHMGVVDMHRWASVGGGTLEIGENEMGGTAVNLTLPVAGVETTTLFD